MMVMPTEPQSRPPATLSEPFRFLDLPAELRVKILNYLVLLPQNAVITNLWNLQPAGSSEMTLTNLLLVCSQMYAEASAIFYTQNNFRINLGTRRMCQQLTDKGGLLSPQCQDVRRRIRSLTLFMKRIGGDFERVIEPALRDMILNGSLRNLELRFWPQDFGKSSVGANGHNSAWTANPPEVGNELIRSYPFQALLKIIADPDLETAELWIWRVHWSIWCPFHDVMGEAGETCAQSMGKLKQDWTSVDVKSLVGSYGDGSRVVRIGERSWVT